MRTPVGFLIMQLMCLFHRSLLSNITPRYLTSFFHSISFPASQIPFRCGSVLLLITGMIVVFVELIFNPTDPPLTSNV
uniref:Uncharacterized protein n=1 Tax=Panstrongylus lignarius TaxID=156445 RepID=A0A224Y3N5_9HEMI